MNEAFAVLSSRSSCECKLKSFFCYYTACKVHVKLACCLSVPIVMAIHCGTVMGGELHTTDENYRLFLLSALFFVWDLKISTHHFLWWSGMENIGAKVDIYLAMSHSITIITTTSYLSGTVHIFSVRQQHPLSLHWGSTWLKHTIQPGKARGIWQHWQSWG